MYWKFFKICENSMYYFEECKFIYISQKKFFHPYEILDNFFLEHSFMSRFWSTFLWMPTLERRKFFIKWSVTSKVIENIIRFTFYLKIHFYLDIFLLLKFYHIYILYKCFYNYIKRKFLVWKLTSEVIEDNF